MNNKNKVRYSDKSQVKVGDVIKLDNNQKFYSGQLPAMHMVGTVCDIETDSDNLIIETKFKKETYTFKGPYYTI